MKYICSKTTEIIFFIFCFIVAGCATYPSTNAPAVDKSMVFSVPYDTAWKKLIETVTQEGEQLSTSDKSGGVLGLQRNIAPGDIELYAYDDTGMSWNQAVAQIAILIAPQDERSTAITINLKVLATGRDAFDVIFSRPPRQMTLHSRGYLEKYYLSSFSKRISAMKKEE
jgi:uncharacterized protein YcfL